MRSCFSDFFDKFASEHHDECRDEARESDRYESIEDTIGVHRYDVGNTRSWEGEWESEWYDESLVEVFMDEMISFNFVDLGGISLFSLYHRECYKE